ncbi:MAG: thiol-disulfide isomerase/thioredoxin [Candidatus Paceibacteria bacterium]|jgi:thiol-disulfide isomerase/thioredoxin
MKVEIIVGGVMLAALGIGGFVLYKNPPENTSSNVEYKINGYEEFKYVEIENPAGFVSSDPFKLEDIVGEKVILIDFVTYSCINCQRTFPYLKEWYEKYEDQGLEIVGIHTPEFAFEKKKENVFKEMVEKWGLTFPLVLDNDYGTWRAWENQYWPRKYLIDIHGNVVYDHIGEGSYDETEKKIIELLKERKEVLGEDGDVSSDLVDIQEIKKDSNSPEAYFGASRNEYLSNGKKGVVGSQEFKTPSKIVPNKLYLAGNWNITEESAVTSEVGSKVFFNFIAKEVNIVASSDEGGKVRIYIDGENVGEYDINEPTLYEIFKAEKGESHVLEIEVIQGEFEIFTFTFG